MKRKFLVAALMLLSVAVLALPSRSDAAPDFCADCAQQCWNDANTGENNQAYWECVDKAGDTQASRDACFNSVIIGYYNACITILCNSTGCKVVRKAPYVRPGDN